jgi:hypothetical protein
MPVTLCSNGKYRIGSGACIYDSEEKAKKALQAILSNGSFRADINKVSIDFDDTLTTMQGQALARRLISQGKEVYIITRRQSLLYNAVYEMADKLGIPRSKVYFTNGRYKWDQIQRLGIGTHYDNNQTEVDLINKNTDTRALKFAAEDSYNDYPQAAVDNAKSALKYVGENGWGSCGTDVGKARAYQLANRENISRDTIARMASFKRHQQYKNVLYEEGCGGLMWDAWGGTEGIEWAIKKLEEIDKTKFEVGIPHYTADGEIWTGETHKDATGRLMTGAVHSADSQYLYHYDELAEIGERGGIVGSDKAPKSKTVNKDPKGQGTAGGDASGKRGAEVTAQQEKTLQQKADDFNERDSNTKNGRATLGALKSVFQRGLGAYNTSHSPLVKSAEQWAYARVNAFLYLLKNGRPENPKYDTDFDLLPGSHPKAK